MNELGFLLNYLGNNQEWSLLDPTEKGYYIELIAYASHPKNLGCIPSDDEHLRNILKLPLPFYNILEEEQDPLTYYFKGFEQYNISQVMLDSIKMIWKNEKSNEDLIKSRFSYEQWIDYFWLTKWKKNILRTWDIVDDKLIKKHSILKDFKGYLWNETAFQISSNDLTPQRTKNNKNVSKKKNIELPDLFSSEFIFSNDDIDIDGIVWLNNDTKNLLDISQTLKAWREPATETQKNHIWNVGVSLLSGNNESKKPQARSMIAKQVKKYGNAPVSKAIGELAAKNNLPPEPIALFLAILKKENEGTREEIKAREKRISHNL